MATKKYKKKPISDEEKAKRKEEQEKKVSAAKEALVKAISGLDSKEEWINFLNHVAKRSKFAPSRLSFINQMLVYMQDKNATAVATYQRWRKIKRWPAKGSKGIMIFRPIPIIIPIEKATPEDIADGNVFTDKSGKTKVKTGRIYFSPMYVFDIAVTEGEDLPPNWLAPPSLPDFDDKEVFSSSVEKLAVLLENKTDSKVKGVKIIARGSKEDLYPKADGWYSKITKKIIVIRDSNRGKMFATLVHEAGHALLHGDDLEPFLNTNSSRAQKEIEAESVCYVVTKALGLDASIASIVYVTSWSKGKKEIAIKQIEESAKRIVKASNVILDLLMPIDDSDDESVIGAEEPFIVSESVCGCSSARKLREPKPTGLKLETVKSKSGNTYKINISGKVGRIPVRGNTTSIHIGLDTVNFELANDIIRVFRDDNTGKAIPSGTRRKIVEAVLDELNRLDSNIKEPKPKASMGINPKQLAMGTTHELEHVDLKQEKKPTKRQLAFAEKIALDHLKEDPKYYTKMKKCGLDEPDPKANIIAKSFERYNGGIKIKRLAGFDPNKPISEMSEDEVLASQEPSPKRKWKAYKEGTILELQLMRVPIYAQNVANSRGKESVKKVVVTKSESGGGGMAVKDTKATVQYGGVKGKLPRHYNLWLDNDGYGRLSSSDPKPIAYEVNGAKIVKSSSKRASEPKPACKTNRKPLVELKKTARSMGGKVAGSDITFSNATKAREFESLLKEDEYTYTKNRNGRNYVFTVGCGEASLTLASLGEPKKMKIITYKRGRSIDELVKYLGQGCTVEVSETNMSKLSKIASEKGTNVKARRSKLNKWNVSVLNPKALVK